MRKRIVKYQPLREVSAREFKDYTEWKELNDDSVNQQAEPELIAEPVKQASPELDLILQVLEEGGENKLPDMQRRIFQLVVREGRSIQDAASQLGIAKGTAQTHLRRAAKKLKALCLTKLR